VISQAEAYRVLEATEAEGLVHVTYNVRDHPMFVCNCCSCCCGFLRALNEFGAPHALASSSFVATIDGGACDTCGACVAPRCPMDAIHPSPDRLQLAVTAERCIGCGVCATACPHESIRLVSRPADERPVPAENITTWTLERLGQRSAIGRMALRVWPLRPMAPGA
jgi:electron transport complex protein RnfB